MRRICLALIVLVFASACVQQGRTPTGRVGDDVGVAFYGGQLSDPPHVRDADLDRVKASGAKWVRLSLNWITLEPRAKGQYNWAPADALVNAARARGLHINAISAYTPAWARSGGSGITPPNRASDFGDFMGALARRYGSKIDAYEIWNEPNLHTMWAPRPDAARYVSLLRAAYPKIKANDAWSTVITGGMSPAWDAPDGMQVLPLTWVRRMYALGAKGYFDAIGHHPSSFPHSVSLREAWNPFQQSRDIYAEMRARGDGSKKIWATELPFPTGGGHEAVSETLQGHRYAEAFLAWKAWSFTGPVFIYSLRDFDNSGNRYGSSGIYRNNGAPKASVGYITNVLRARG